MNVPAAPESTLSLPRLETVLLLLLVAITCVICWPSMKAPLMLDDFDQLDHVSHFKSWKDVLGTDSFGLFRPVKNIVFHYFKGIPLIQWHSITLVTYVAAVLGVYALFRRLFGSPVWAFTGALIWASAPTQVSSAIWMSAVNLSLAMALGCVCLIFHDKSRSDGSGQKRWVVLTCLVLLLAQISYETAVAIPGLCVLVDLLKKREIFSRPAMVRYVALGLVTLGYLLLRSQLGASQSVQSQNFGFAPDTKAWQLSVSAPWFLWRHFSMWWMPLGRIEFCSTYIWGRSASMLDLAAAWVWLFCLLGAIFLVWKRLPVVAIGLLWFLAASFPPSNFVPIWSGPIEDYYLFFPSVGLVIAVIGLAMHLLPRILPSSGGHVSRTQIVSGTALALIGFSRLLCIPLFWLQADLWNRPVELFLRCETSRPFQFQLQATAARELMLAGRLEEAKALALQSYETGPWFASSGMMLGYIALQEQRFPEAIEKLKDTLKRTKPNSPMSDFSRLHLANAQNRSGATPEAVKETLLPLLKDTQGSYHKDAIRLQIDCYLAHNQPEDALRAAKKSVQLHPDDTHFAKLLKLIEEKQPPSATQH